MKPLLDELRDIARQRKKSVAQVKNNLICLGFRIPSPTSSSCLVLPIPSCSGDGIYSNHASASKQASHFLPSVLLPACLSIFLLFLIPIPREILRKVALNWNLQKGFLVLVGIRSVEQVCKLDNYENCAITRQSAPQFFLPLSLFHALHIFL